jgi:uncharacterized membrane protein YciS (DUF1049 family)
MKIIIITGAWIVGWLVSIFLILLICRLEGDSTEIYNFKSSDYEMCTLLFLLWPVALVIGLLYLLLKLLKKSMIVAIETIVAYRNIKKEQTNGNDD